MSAQPNIDLFPLSGARVVPLGLIVPGQYQPRKRFPEAKMREMAASIKANGVMQPILVRPIEDGKLEIVAGERRWRGTKMAGLDDIPAMIREMSLMEVLELQAIENIQREDLHPMEEAYSFSLLISPPDGSQGYTIAQIAERVGKDASHVSRRLVLQRLIPPAADAFLDGHIALATAISIARIPHTIQERAFPLIMGTRAGDDKMVAHRDAMRILEGAFMLRLANAAFPIQDARLVPAAGGCNVCPKRTGASPDLFDDVKEADTCTDPDCHSTKVNAWNKRRKAEARKAGIEVLDGKAATALLKFGPSSDALNGDYVYLDQPLPDLTGSKSALAKLLGTLIKPSALFEHPRDQTLREIVHVVKLTEVLKEHSMLVQRPTKGEQAALVGPLAPAKGKAKGSLESAPQPADIGPTEADLLARIEAERAWRVDLIKAVHAALHSADCNVSIVLRRATAMELALTFLDDADNWALISELWGWKAGKNKSLRERLEVILAEMTETQLDLLMGVLIMLPDLDVKAHHVGVVDPTLMAAQACDDVDADLGIDWRTFRAEHLAGPKLKKGMSKKVSHAPEPSIPPKSPTPAGGIKGVATERAAGKPAAKQPKDKSQAPSAQTRNEGSDLPHWVGQMVKVKGHKRVGEISELNADGSLVVAIPNGDGSHRNLVSALRADVTVLPGQQKPAKPEQIIEGSHVRIKSTNRLAVVRSIITTKDQATVEVEIQKELGPASAWPFPGSVKVLTIDEVEPMTSASVAKEAP